MSQSTMMTGFYQAYLAWLEAGAPDRAPFRREDGLCDNLSNWPEIFEGDNHRTLCRELQDQFRKAELNIVYPFNAGDFSEYMHEHDNRAMHRNPARIQWVKEHAA